MMTIKDLSVSKDLDRAAMTEVRGGQEFNIGTFSLQDLNINGADHSVGSPTIGIQVATPISVVTGVEQNFNGLLGPVSAF